MENLESDRVKQFEFVQRRVVTENGPHRAACRYDSAENNEDEEEMALSNEFYDLDMLPDTQPGDLFQYGKSQERFSFNKNKKGGGGKGMTGKPMKPLISGQSQIPHKVFNQYSSSCYNSRKNLRNQNKTHANNRYSSQNMKSFDAQDDEEPFEDEIAKESDGDVMDLRTQKTMGEENNFFQTEMSCQNRRSSQRYKDRLRQIRVQSQETCNRDAIDNTQEYDICGQDDEEEGILHREILTRGNQMNIQRNLRVESEIGLTNQRKMGKINDKGNVESANLLFVARPSQEGISYGQEELPEKEDDEAKEIFKGRPPKEDGNVQEVGKLQYQEILKRLSDMTLSNSMERKGSLGQSSSNKTGKRKSRTNKVYLDKTDKREPLKEKTSEVNNQPAMMSDKKKSKIIPQGSAVCQGAGNAYELSGKFMKKEVSKTSKVQDRKMKKIINSGIRNDKMTQQQSQQRQIANILMQNQENNFIEKKLKDQSRLNPNMKEEELGMKGIYQGSVEKLDNQQINQVLGQKSNLNQSSINNIKFKANNLFLGKEGQKDISMHEKTALGIQKNQYNSILMNLQNNGKEQIKGEQTKTQQESQKMIKQNENITLKMKGSKNIINHVVNNKLNPNTANNILGGMSLGQKFLQQNGINLQNKCSSTNQLRGLNSGQMNNSSKSSTMLTQSSSNKQFAHHSRETPECPKQRMKVSGTAGSSTSKRAGIVPQTLTNTLTSSVGGTGTNRNSATLVQASESNTKRSIQNSEQKQVQNKSHNSQINPQKNIFGNSQSNSNKGSTQDIQSYRSNSNQNQKEEIKKMVIGNLKDKNEGQNYAQFLKQGSQQIIQGQESSQFYQNVHQSLAKVQIKNTHDPISIRYQTGGMNANEGSAFTLKRVSNASQTRVSDSRKNSTAGSSKTISKTGALGDRNIAKGLQMSNGGSVQSNSKSITRKQDLEKVSLSSKMASSRIGANAYPVSASSSQPQSSKKNRESKGEFSTQHTLQSKLMGMAEFAPKGSFKSLKSEEQEEGWKEATPSYFEKQKGNQERDCDYEAIKNEKHVQSNQTLKKLNELVKKGEEQMQPSQVQQSILINKQVKKTQNMNQKRPFSGKPKQSAYQAKARPINQNRNNFFPQSFASAQGIGKVDSSVDNRTHMQIPHKTIEKKVNTGKLNYGYDSSKPIGHQVKVQYTYQDLVTETAQTESQYLATQNGYRMSTMMDEGEEKQHTLLSQMPKPSLMHPPLSGQRNTQNVKIKAKNF